jgi:NAD(P)-dependent dehydrogenase (short-subunit alcohol dehydrogenase family)
MEGRTIVITGASGGIGAALARRAAAAGAQVVLAARRAPELNAVAAACGSGAFPLVTDVTRRGEVERLLDAAVARFGHVDAWVNNAGRGITKPVSQLTDDEFDEMMRVNVKSALYGMQAVLPHFQTRGRGHIVNVSSMLGRVPFASWRSAYNASKHALNALTASLRIELRERWPEIHVTTVSPGVVATEFGVHALGDGADSPTLPNAQPVDEVADVILEVLRHPRADVYTRAGLRERVVAYFSADDMGAFEAGFAPAPAEPSKQN